MKKKPLLVLLTLTALLALSACGSSGSSGKKCGGDTCKIGYRYNPSENSTR